MKKVLLVSLIVVLASVCWGQDPALKAVPPVNSNTIRVALTAGSTQQTGEVLEVFQEKCSDINVTLSQEKADYFLEASDVPPHVKYVLFNKDGDAIFLATPAHSDNAAKDICKFLGRLRR